MCTCLLGCNGNWYSKFDGITRTDILPGTSWGSATPSVKRTWQELSCDCHFTGGVWLFDSFKSFSYVMQTTYVCCLELCFQFGLVSTSRRVTRVPKPSASVAMISILRALLTPRAQAGTMTAFTARHLRCTTPPRSGALKRLLLRGAQGRKLAARRRAKSLSSQ
jgi:hypothetical protein